MASPATAAAIATFICHNLLSLSWSFCSDQIGMLNALMLPQVSGIPPGMHYCFWFIVLAGLMVTVPELPFVFFYHKWFSLHESGKLIGDFSSYLYNGTFWDNLNHREWIYISPGMAHGASTFTNNSLDPPFDQCPTLPVRWPRVPLCGGSFTVDTLHHISGSFSNRPSLFSFTGVQAFEMT